MAPDMRKSLKRVLSTRMSSTAKKVQPSRSTEVVDCKALDSPRGRISCYGFPNLRTTCWTPVRSVPKPSQGDSPSLPSFFIKEEDARVVSQASDGSCLFHALTYGLGDGSDAPSLRLAISDFIVANPELNIAGTSLKDWVAFDSGDSVSAYAARLLSGLWGGGIEIQVLSQIKNTNVHVYEPCDGGYKRISCFEAGPKATKTLNILYRERGSGGGEHYDALLLMDSDKDLILQEDEL